MRAPTPISQGLPGQTGNLVPFCRYLSQGGKAVATVSREAAYEDEEKGAGWLIFAASMLGLVGILSIIDGIVALSRSRFYTNYGNATYVFSDLRTWGWITLVIGILAIVA